MRYRTMSKKCNSAATTVNERSIGIDVHLNKLVACFIEAQRREDGSEKQQIEFKSTTAEHLGVEEMSQWVQSKNPDSIIFESTSVYWLPLYKALENRGLDPEVINPRLLFRRDEGRKTDTSDAQWLAQMARLGMYRKSFIPEEPFRSLRMLLTAHRATVNEYRNNKNRLLKYLDSCGIHFSAVFSDPHGQSARAVLHLVLEGEATEENIEKAISQRCSSTPQEILCAVGGDIDEVKRYLIERALSQLDGEEQRLERDYALMEKYLKPYKQWISLLETIPGIRAQSAQDIIAIVGTNIGKHFANAAKFARWAGCCPGNRESAGKRKSEKMPHGLKAFKTTIIECAQGAARTKGTRFFERFMRKRHKGYKAAIGAVAHLLVKVIYHVLTAGTLYVDCSDLHQKFKRFPGATRSRWILQTLNYAKNYPQNLGVKEKKEICELYEMLQRQNMRLKPQFQA